MQAIVVFVSCLLSDARPGNASKGASFGFGGGLHYLSCIIFGCQCMKKCDGLVKECAFHCVGVGGVVHPMSCRTLGWAMHQKAHHLALAKACICFYFSFLVGNV